MENKAAHIVSEGCRLLSAIANQLAAHGYVRSPTLEHHFNDKAELPAAQRTRLPLGMMPRHIVFERQEPNHKTTYAVLERGKHYLPHLETPIGLWQQDEAGRYHEAARRLVRDFF